MRAIANFELSFEETEQMLARAKGCIDRNMAPGEQADMDTVIGWAVGAAIRFIRGEPEPGEKLIVMTEKPLEGTILPPKHMNGFDRTKPKELLRAEAMGKGYIGDACTSCGNFTLIRNGTCFKCDTCGGTSGCS